MYYTVGVIAGLVIIGIASWVFIRFRRSPIKGKCPVCENGLIVDPREHDALSCPYCSALILVDGRKLTGSSVSVNH